MNRLIRTLLLTLLITLLAPVVVLAQDNQPKPADPNADSKKALAKLKTLSGSWQTTIMGIPINVTIRAASSGTAVLHEGHTSKEGPPKNEITMFYRDGNRLLATHYCDGGNRSHMEGKLSGDEKSIAFSFLEVVGSTRGGYLKDMVISFVDADHHIAAFTFIMPDGKPIPLRGEFQRTTSSANLLSGNKRLYDGGAMMLLLSAQKMPEEFYGFKPTDTLMSFGEALADVADWQYKSCSAVLGETNPKAKTDASKASKADLIVALREAFAYCGKAYDGMTESIAVQSVAFPSLAGPLPMPKQSILDINNGLNSLHYGNLMIYMRLKNIVPPSSDPELLKKGADAFKAREPKN